MSVCIIIVLIIEFINCISTKKELENYSIVDNEQINLGTIKLCASKSDFEVFRCKKGGYIAFSRAINRYLQTNPKIETTIDKKYKEKKKRLIKSDVMLFNVVLKKNFKKAMENGGNFYNQEKLCLAEDLKYGMSSILCGKGEYYCTYLTNRIWNKVIVNNNTGDRYNILSDRITPYNNFGQMQLKSITDSCMNNEIGVATIGITSDHYVVFWVQSRKAQYSQGLLLPTGSGSCDWKDHKLNKGNFLETLKFCMERELCEESQLSSLEFVDKTLILGYYNWIDYGGKPEFAGITKLNCELKELTGNKKEVERQEKYSFKSIEDLIDLISGIIMSNDNIATPLEANLKFLLDYCNNYKDDIKAFIY
jgi:hypothetical protein